MLVLDGDNRLLEALAFNLGKHLFDVAFAGAQRRTLGLAITVLGDVLDVEGDKSPFQLLKRVDRFDARTSPVAGIGAHSDPLAAPLGELQDRAGDVRDCVPLPLEPGMKGVRSHLFAEYPEPQPRVEYLERRYSGFNGSHLNRSLRAVRSKKLKLIVSSRGEEELYDLEQDPGEAANVADVNPTELEELREEEKGPVVEIGARPGGVYGPGHLQEIADDLETALAAIGDPL